MIKKKFALIGYPLKHTISPFIHQRLFKLNKIKAEYKLLNIKPEHLAHNYKTILKSLDGYNITIPNKIKIMNFVDKIDYTSKICGSINTVKNNLNKSYGFNTDINGFLKSTKNNKISLTGNIVILGAGGAARAVSFACSNYAKTITLAIRETSFKKAKYILYTLKNTPAKIKITSINNLNTPIDVLINATPVGMFPNQNAVLVNENILKNCKCVIDLIYNPYETILLKKAKANGSQTLGGLDMLVWQAAFAQKIWNDVDFNIQDINEIIEESKLEIARKFNEI